MDVSRGTLLDNFPSSHSRLLDTVGPYQKLPYGNLNRLNLVALRKKLVCVGDVGTVFVAIIVPVDNKKNAFWGPLFESEIVGIFGVFIVYFALIDPSRPFFRTIFVMPEHLSITICFFKEILTTKQ